MKLSTSVSKLLTNKYVLYLVAVLALVNVLGYLMMGKMQAVILFVLVGYLMSHFSKNMTIVLLTPLFIINLLMSGKAVKEGLEAMTDDEDKKKKEDGDGPMMTGTQAPNTSDQPSTDIESDTVTENYDNPNQKTNPMRIDRASTLEAAYDNLSGVLGGDGIKRLTGDTKKLMNQQLQLAEAMKDMGPLLQQAQGMLKSLNVNELGDLGSVVKQLTGSLGEKK